MLLLRTKKPLHKKHAKTDNNMKVLKLFLVAILMAWAQFLNAQPALEGDAYSTQHDHFGHHIFPMSFTVMANIDMGNEVSLYRTIDIQVNLPLQPWNELSEINQLITSSGSDHFTVPLPLGGGWGWNLKLHYRYTSDPDGSGPLNAGDDAVPPKIISSLQSVNLETIISSMEIYGPYLDVEVTTNRYDGGVEYYAVLVLEVLNTTTGVMTHYIQTDVNPAGTWQFTKTYNDLYLFEPGVYCVTARYIYSHLWAGLSDFENDEIDATSGENCLPYNMDFTGVETISFASGWITVHEVVKTVVTDLSGREVASYQGNTRFDTTEWPDGIYVVTTTTEDDKRQSKKFSVVR